MEIDPRYAHFVDAQGNQFQVIKPQEFADVPVVDDDGNPTGDTQLVALPREWDEVATAKAMGANRG